MRLYQIRVFRCPYYSCIYQARFSVADYHFKAFICHCRLVCDDFIFLQSVVLAFLCQFNDTLIPRIFKCLFNFFNILVYLVKPISPIANNAATILFLISQEIIDTRVIFSMTKCTEVPFDRFNS